MTKQQLLTRRELREFLAANGFPVSKQFLIRECSPSQNAAGPPVAEVAGQGRAYLYRADQVLKWAREELVLVPRGKQRELASRRKDDPLHATA
jgi:hypothetical protein